MTDNKVEYKIIKNPFAKIHQTAIDNSGFLSDDARKKMMRAAIEELRGNTEKLYDVEISRE